MVERRYLSYYEVISQIWLHPAIVAMVVLIFKICLFSKSLTAAVDLNSVYTVDLCNTLNEYNSYAAGVPDKLGLLYNTMLYEYLRNYHVLILRFISFIITIIKNLVEFYIEVYLGTYTCLLNALIKGTIAFVADAIETLTQALNTSMNTIITELQSGLSSLSTVINGIVNGVNSVIDFFSSNLSSSVEQSFSLVNLTISKLEHLNISSTSITASLDELLQKIPNLDNLTSETIDMIASPLINLFSDLNLSSFINSSELPSLKLEQPSLCSPTSIDQFYSKLSHSVTKASNFINIALSISILLFLLCLLFKEYRALSKQSTFLDLLHSCCQVDDNKVQFRNYLQTYLNPVLFYLNPYVKNDNLHWLISFTTNTYALTPLALGLLGILCVSLQFSLLSVVKHQIRNLDDSALSSISDFGNSSIVKNGNILIESKETVLNSQITNGIVSVTGEFSSSIETLLSTMNDTITTVFSNTPFESPINTIVYCTIGRKLIKIENGLNWITNNFNVTIPQLPQSEIAELFETKMTSLTDNIGDSISKGLSKVVSAYESSVWWELYVLLIFVSIWFLFVIAGGCKIMYTHYFKPKELAAAIAPGDISEPMPLTENEKQQYGYPFRNPFDLAKHKPDQSSSIYSS